MRLVRFLAAGKSLVGLKDLVGRYRLPSGRTLPQFGNAKENVFSTPHQNMAQATPPDSKTGAERGTKEAVGVSSQTPGGVEPALKLSPNQELPETRVKHRSILRNLFGWLPWYRGGPGRRTIPAFSKLPVQTELSLDNVKVARNDLSESDLEIRRPKADKKVMPLKQPAVPAPSSPVEVGSGISEIEGTSRGG